VPSNYRIFESVLCLCALLITTLAHAVDGSYDFPHHDGYVATIVGTPEEDRAELPKSIPLKNRRIVMFEDRAVPDAIWFERELRYSVALQNRAAPLVFLIAGTGAAHNGAKNRDMARAFYQAGFHIVSLSSPTTGNFVVSASSTGVPGHAERDAEDLYRVMGRVWGELRADISVTDFYLTGYSLGGFNAAFVSKLDEERQVFDFDKVLLINPPVSLYNSISLLDRMIENIPGGEENFHAYIENLMKGFTEVYKQHDDSLDFGDDFLYKAYETMDLKNEELAALVGVSFRLSSSSMAFFSDLMTNYGYVKPKNVQLNRHSDLSEYRQVVDRLGFTDYYHEFFFPYYRDSYPGVSRDEFIQSMSLNSIEGYLRSAKKITVIHNQNDIILLPGEIDFFPEVFGDRATIYPYGGHCGNMAYRDNVALMVSTFGG
jgi:predicted alpha/beta-fold hydrolase